MLKPGDLRDGMGYFRQLGTDMENAFQPPTETRRLTVNGGQTPVNAGFAVFNEFALYPPQKNKVKE